jgi:hypothetical protein
MNRSASLSILILLFCAVAFFMSLNGCSGISSSSTPITVPSPSLKIQHVVIIFQENRTRQSVSRSGTDLARRGYRKRWGELERPDDPAG